MHYTLLHPTSRMQYNAAKPFGNSRVHSLAFHTIFMSALTILLLFYNFALHVLLRPTFTVCQSYLACVTASAINTRNPYKVISPKFTV